MGHTRSTSHDGWRNKAEYYALTHFPQAWAALQRSEPIKRLVNKRLINNVIYKIPTRPYPLSTLTPYTSWDSLTNRAYSGRHLPAGTLDPATLPAVEDVVRLFARPPGSPTPRGKSSVLFAHFAQWFTDGFLRTDRDDYFKNTSNHDIDLCPLYGLNRSVTTMLRSHQGGRLKSQMIGGEEYPPLAFAPDGSPLPAFAGLPVLHPDDLPLAQRARLFAMGVERGNVQIGYMMLNTLFLREHNRVCGLLHRAYPSWDDERLFQTARNVVIVLLLRVVVEEYINHITPYHFQFMLDPKAFATERWYRQNWMCVEFSLVYRWHGLVPDHYRVAGAEYKATDAMFNGELLTSCSLGQLFEEASQQPAGEASIGNTPPFLLEVERASILLGRQAQLASYNDYRELCGYPRVTAFNQITANLALQQGLQRLYGHVDQIEFYVGLFAEDVRPDSAVGPLVGRIVGIDAFSQALTNPLLAENVFNSRTFSPLGMRVIAQTRTLSEVLHRNLPPSSRHYHVSMTLNS